jgi:hypothetical protein
MARNISHEGIVIQSEHKDFSDYKYLLQKNYVEYKHIKTINRIQTYTNNKQNIDIQTINRIQTYINNKQNTNIHKQ